MIQLQSKKPEQINEVVSIITEFGSATNEVIHEYINRKFHMSLASVRGLTKRMKRKRVLDYEMRNQEVIRKDGIAMTRLKKYYSLTGNQYEIVEYNPARNPFNK